MTRISLNRESRPTAYGRDREVAMEPGSRHSGCDLALAYGGYLCSRQTSATGQKRTID